MDINQVNSQSKTPLAPSENRKIDSSSPVRVNDDNNLKPGQYIRGIVTDLRYDEAKILLEHSQETILAKLDGDFTFSIGQLAVFIVNEVSPDIISLKAVANMIKPELETTIEKALKEAGFSLNDLNKSIVQELLNNRMSIGKHVLQYLIKQAHLNKGTAPDTLIQMYRFNIPITKENIAQFEAMQEGSNNLLLDLNNTVKNILNLLHPSSQPTVSVNRPDTSEKVLVDRPYKSSIRDRIFDERDNSPNKAMDINKEVLNFLLRDANEIQPQPSSAVMANSGEVNQYILNDREVQELASLIGKIVDKDELKALFREGPITTRDVFSFINKNISRWDTSTAHSVINTPIYRKLVEKALENRWSITPKQIEKGLPIDDFFKKIEKDMEELERIFQLTTQNTSNEKITEAETPIKKITDQVNFMKSLNDMFMYLQLPVQLKKQIAHSELYVFRRKGSLNNRRESISALIHMDMTYLGAIDIHISLNNKLINTTFYTADRLVGQILEQNLPTLHDKLLDKGFHVKARVKNTDDKADLEKTLWGHDLPHTTISRYTFDIRT
ncbi:MAG: flagellar hook-length control protein FliK [Clostridiales bacterium]|nr:flagellar hook-length control protein FliK [Clostridiales bacterium]